MKWFLLYLLFQFIVALVFWMISKRKDKRYKTNGGNLKEGFEPTDEVSIDPISNAVTRVYINPRTGERQYIDEKSKN